MSTGVYVRESSVNPYREFAITVAAGETFPIYYAFNYFRILSATANGLTARFGSSGSFTTVIGAGIGLRLEQVIDRVDIRNETGAPISATIALMVGQIDDSRLTLTGDVNLTKADVFAENANVTVNNTATLIAAQNLARREIFISNRDSSANLYVGGSTVNSTTRQGVVVAPGATLILDTTAEIYGITPLTSIDVSLAETAD